MARITISYRREDSGVITGRIFDRLVAQYGREAIFRDIDDVPFGVDFREHISRVLDESDVVLAVVGPRWLGPRGTQNRLNNEADPVRVEIEIALRNGIPLIPLLVLRGQMPQAAQLPQLAAAKSIPLPQDLQVRRPGPDIPASMARFSGVWGGDSLWNGRCRKMLLAIETMEASGGAIVLYAASSAGPGCYGNPTSYYGRAYAKIQGASLEFAFPAGFDFKFTLVDNDYLSGSVAANPNLKPPYKGAVILISRLN